MFQRSKITQLYSQEHVMKRSKMWKLNNENHQTTTMEQNVLFWLHILSLSLSPSLGAFFPIIIHCVHCTRMEILVSSITEGYTTEKKALLENEFSLNIIRLGQSLLYDSIIVKQINSFLMAIQEACKETTRRKKINARWKCFEPIRWSSI